MSKERSIDYVIDKAISDLSTSLKHSLNKILENNKDNENILKTLKNILFELPEYKDLERENKELREKLMELSKKNDEQNIKLTIEPDLYKNNSEILSEVENINTSTKNNVISSDLIDSDEYLESEGEEETEEEEEEEVEEEKGEERGSKR